MSKGIAAAEQFWKEVNCPSVQHSRPSTTWTFLPAGFTCSHPPLTLVYLLPSDTAWPSLRTLLRLFPLPTMRPVLFAFKIFLKKSLFLNRGTVDLQWCVCFKNRAIYAYTVYMYIYTVSGIQQYMHIYIHIYNVYRLFCFRFFSSRGYYNILNIAPCAILGPC